MNYAMSDLHGCFDKYQRMLRLIDFAPEDTLYILGDVIDRGPDGVKILQDMMGRPNILPILGNHEFTAAICLPWLLEEVTGLNISKLGEAQIAALSEWIANGGKATLDALQKSGREERREILDYLRDMDLYAEVEAGGRAFVLTHSGLNHFSPEKELEDYALEDFLFCRTGLDTAYYRDKILVLGHTPTGLLGGANKIFRRDTWINIDCGCAFDGGHLGCLCLDTMEEFYV